MGTQDPIPTNPNESESWTLGRSPSVPQADGEPPTYPACGPEENGGLTMSYSVDPAEFELRIGLRLNPKILALRPQGARLILILNPPPAEYGGIVLPEQWRGAEKLGSGWVIAVGPCVGQGGPYPSGPLGPPWSLLYRQVIIGSTVGKVIRADLLDRMDKSPYVTITDRDIWAVDTSPPAFRDGK